MTAPFEPLAPPKAPSMESESLSVEAVHAVIKENAPFVGRSLRYLGVRESDVEDAAQDVFLVVHKRLGSFEGRSSLRTWLYGVCVRVAAAMRRRASHRYEALASEPPEQATAPQQEQHVVQSETKRRLLAALDQLDEDKRAVFVLYEIEQQSIKDIAEALGCPVQTAYYRLHAARNSVLEMFDPTSEAGGQP